MSSRGPTVFNVPMASHTLDSSTLETTQGNAESLNSFKTEAVHKNESSYLHQIGGNDVVEKYVPPSPKIPSSGGLNGYIDRVASSPPIAFSPRQASKQPVQNVVEKYNPPAPSVGGVNEYVDPIALPSTMAPDKPTNTFQEAAKKPLQTVKKDLAIDTESSETYSVAPNLKTTTASTFLSSTKSSIPPEYWT